MSISRSISFQSAVALILVGSVAFGADFAVESHVKSVTVYNDRAMVTRVAEFEIPSGSHKLVFSDVPPSADDGSIRAALSSHDIQIVGLTQKPTLIQGDKKDRAKIQSKLDSLWSAVIVFGDRKAVFEKQKQMLERIASPYTQSDDEKSSNVPFDPKNWEAAVSFVGKQFRGVLDSLRILNTQDNNTRSLCNTLQDSLDALNLVLDRNVKQIVLDIEAPVATRGTVVLNYIIPNASWKALYNARLLDSSQVEIQYLAEVSQNTGEDWQDAELTLSSAQPSRVTDPEDLKTRSLSVIEQLGYGNVSSSNGVVVAERDLLQITDIANLKAEDIKNMPASTVSDLLRLRTGVVGVQASTTAYSAQFVISRRETVKSGAGPSKVVVAQWRLEGEEKLIVRTQNYMHAFRNIELTNDTETAFMPGEIYLFAGGDYVGRLFLAEFVLPGQKFELAFGIDDQIEVEREMRNRKTDVDDDDRKLSETVVITLTNHSKLERTVSLEEAFPYSSDSRVKVNIKPSTPKPSEIDSQNKAKWEIRLKPSEKLVMSTDYEIEYPNTLSISGI